MLPTLNSLAPCQTKQQWPILPQVWHTTLNQALKQILLLPRAFSGTLQATKGVLNAFATALAGPAANPIQALDGALQAAGDVLGVQAEGLGVPVPKFLQNINMAVGLLSKLGA